MITAIADLFKFGGSNVFMGYSWQVVGGASSGVVGLILFAILVLNHKAVSFVDDVFAEVKKTTWPNSKETTSSTIVVSIMVGFAALMFMMMDYFWGVFFRAIL
jgi:preprotein translocase SecE subunit